MVPAERIELPTFGLQNRCTTAVLRRRGEVDFTEYKNRLPIVTITIEPFKIFQPKTCNL